MGVTAQQQHICFVIGRLVCTSTLRWPLSRICGTAEQVIVSACILMLAK
jgi:hypothetical protein